MVLVYKLPRISGFFYDKPIIISDSYGNHFLMFERQERLALMILGVVLLICTGGAVVFEMLGKEPFSQPFSPDLPDGTLVSHEGTVQKVSRVGEGSSIILDIAGVQVFIPVAPEGGIPDPGDRISLLGTVQTWKGKREIVVSEGKDFRILEKSQGKNLHS